MPKFEVEVDDKGEFIGSLPAEVDAILKRIEITAHGTGFRSGQGKATEDAKKQIEDAIKSERLKIEASLPLEREKWQSTDEENKALKQQLTDRIRESDRTLRGREEAHAEELTKRVEALSKRNAKIHQLVKAQIQGLALQAGAREESLPELEVILGSMVGYDDDMESFVKGPDEKPLMMHGKPITLQQFVKSYIDNHPHHRKPAAGAGGGARGGASFRGHEGTVSLDAAKSRIEAGDRSPSAINELFEAGRKRPA